MANDKNTSRSDEDEERDMKGVATGSVDVANHGEPEPEAARSSLDDLLREYIVPTPYLDDEAKLGEKAAKSTQEKPESISEYQILGFEYSEEVDEEDVKFNIKFRPTLENAIQEPSLLPNDTQERISNPEDDIVLATEENERHGRLWALWLGSTYREGKILAYRNEGMSPEGAAGQADVLFRDRILPIFEDGANPGDFEFAAFLQEFKPRTLEDSLELYRLAALQPNENESPEPLIPKETEDKVWETWCVTFGLTSRDIADFFKENPLAKQQDSYQYFQVQWVEKLVATGLTEAETLEKLDEFCAWAIRTHSNKPADPTSDQFRGQAS
jgi:hypothetical protein